MTTRAVTQANIKELSWPLDRCHTCDFIAQFCCTTLSCRVCVRRTAIFNIW